MWFINLVAICISIIIVALTIFVTATIISVIIKQIGGK